MEEEGQELKPILVRDGDLSGYQAEKDTLENILEEFNRRFGDVDWKEPDKVRKTLVEDIPELLREDEGVINAPDRQNAKEVSNKRLKEEIKKLMMSQTEIYKKYMQDPDFQKKYQDFVFDLLWSQKEKANK